MNFENGLPKGTAQQKGETIKYKANGQPYIQHYKKDKVKSFKNIQILDNVKEYLPEDVSREEIEEMVLNAIGSSGIDTSRYVKGKNLTKEHVEAIIDILYMTLIGRNNGDKTVF